LHGSRSFAAIPRLCTATHGLEITERIRTIHSTSLKQAHRPLPSNANVAPAWKALTSAEHVPPKNPNFPDCPKPWLCGHPHLQSLDQLASTHVPPNFAKVSRNCLCFLGVCPVCPLHTHHSTSSLAPIPLPLPHHHHHTPGPLRDPGHTPRLGVVPNTHPTLLALAGRTAMGAMHSGLDKPERPYLILPLNFPNPDTPVLPQSHLPAHPTHTSRFLHQQSQASHLAPQSSR
jgi:hypothetical protein